MFGSNMRSIILSDKWQKSTVYTWNAHEKARLFRWTMYKYVCTEQNLIVTNT